MSNDFQKYMIEQGYYRNEGSLIWLKDGLIVSGYELNRKFKEWKNQ